MATKTIKANITLFDPTADGGKGAFVARDTPITLDADVADDIIARHGGENVVLQDPGNTQQLLGGIAGGPDSPNNHPPVIEGEEAELLTEAGLMKMKKVDLVALAASLEVEHAHDATMQQITDAILAKQQEEIDAEIAAQQNAS